MGRIRSVKPELAQSESLSRVSREARFLFMPGLFTIADDAGRLRGNALMLARQLFPYDDDPALPQLVESWLVELETRAKCIVRYAVGGDQYIAILDFVESATIKPDRADWAQRIDHPSVSKIPAPPFAKPHETSGALAHHAEPTVLEPRETSRDLATSAETTRSLANPREDLTGGSGKGDPREDSRTLAPDLDLDHRPRPDSWVLAKDREDPGVDEIFDRFWEGRLQRAGPDPREAARREFMAAVRKGDDPEAIEAGMLRYAAANADKAGTRFAGRTDRALKDRVWEDYPPPKLAVVPTAPPSEPAPPAGPEDECWARVKTALRAELGQDVFASWIAKIEFAAFGHGVVLLVTPTRFIKDWVGSHHGDTLLRAWRAEDGAVQRVNLLARGIDPVVLPEPIDQAAPAIQPAIAAAKAATGAAAAAAGPAEDAADKPTASRSPDEVARDAVETDGVTQVVSYGRTKPQAIALTGRWMAIAGAKVLAQLLGEVKTLGLKDQHAIRWVEQQVKAHTGQTVLPGTKPPADATRSRRPQPLVVQKRSAGKRR